MQLCCRTVISPVLLASHGFVNFSRASWNSPNSYVLLLLLSCAETESEEYLTDSSLRHSFLPHRCPVNEFDMIRPSLITRAIVASTLCNIRFQDFFFFFFFRRYRDTERSTLTRRWSNNSSLSSLFFRLCPLSQLHRREKRLLLPLRISSIRQELRGYKETIRFGFFAKRASKRLMQFHWMHSNPANYRSLGGPVESPRAERRRSGLVKLPH